VVVVAAARQVQLQCEPRRRINALMRSVNNDKRLYKSTNIKSLPTPLPVERAILKLGGDLALARRRRQISQASLAERMGASLSTVRRMEGGDARVPIHFIARALHVFSELQALSHLLDTARDDIGLTLMDEQLPQRIHTRRSKHKTGAL
jgi:DNA-binding XRE family transcriptional regulator